MTERLKVHAWKACVRHKRTGGSNPPLSALFYDELKFIINLNQYL